MLPPASMYSADSSHSSIVAEMPRLSSIGLARVGRARAAASSSACCARRPAGCRAYCSISSICAISMTSVTSLRSCRSAARAQHLAGPLRRGPGSCTGELRGLNAPPRSTLAPARLTAAAVVSTCSSDSAEHGPAMTITSSPPIRTSPIVMTVFSGLNVRLASLYGSLMRSTSCTPSWTSISCGSPVPTRDLRSEPAGARRLVHAAQAVAGEAQPVSHAVEAREVGRRLCRRNDVVDGNREVGVRQRDLLHRRTERLQIARQPRRTSRGSPDRAIAGKYSFGSPTTSPFTSALAPAV